ncbi:hypothetical protein D3P09_06895 [Paenibacillus pinisoli]|uniref:Uncharacterized protein n=1 Tax=Paenibacillus pinisoli TaxID=1276110 RepID=A0A3A6Q753_9BACL|nr:hypothetical protein [Paenibacillus pinisoli]RJX41674.1 hypothetical protein D3P09_06895 [Paenibacillus pinisoli]
MKVLGMLIPTYRIGTEVVLSDTQYVIKGNAELYELLNKKVQQQGFEMLKKGTKLQVVSMAKYSFKEIGKTICYGVAYRNKLYIVAEDGLSNI